MQLMFLFTQSQEVGAKFRHIFRAPFDENYYVGLDWVPRSAYLREPCPTSAIKLKKGGQDP
jgi:hypothetical protein